MSEAIAQKRRITRCATLLASALAFAVGIGGIAGKPGWNPLVPLAEQQAGNIAVTTGVAYASLRAVDAVLSTLQEVEVGAGIGVSGSVHPLKFLEPMDDMVERVSDVIFAIAIGGALAAVGLGTVATIGAFALGLGLLCYTARTWLTNPPRWITRLAARLTRMGLTAAVILPLVFAGGVKAGEMLTQSAYEEAKAALTKIGGEHENRPGEARESAGFLGIIKNPIADYMAQAKNILGKAPELLRAALTLIGIFLLRMLVLPALLFWVALSCLKRGAAGG